MFITVASQQEDLEFNPYVEPGKKSKKVGADLKINNLLVLFINRFLKNGLLKIG